MVGGITGWSRNGEIRNSYSTGTVFASATRAGGFSGILDSNLILENSYSAGSVTASNLEGGLVASWDPGDGVTISSSYWNMESSGKDVGCDDPACPDVTGYNSGQMTSQANFVGWDFTDVWAIEEGISYPCHKRFVARGGSCPRPEV